MNREVCLNCDGEFKEGEFQMVSEASSTMNFCSDKCMGEWLKEKIEKEIEQLKANDYEEIDDLRIYKWENKPVKDFLDNMPKGFRLATFNEFNELIESKKYKLKIWDYYWVQHWNERQREMGRLSAVYFVNDDVLYSDNGCIDNSHCSGRVVVMKINEEHC